MNYFNSNSMSKLIVLVYFILLPGFHIYGQAQNMYLPSGFEISNLPVWAQKMYSQNPNVLEVDSLFRNYYRANPFEKSYHTQYYKRWRRSVADKLNDQGFIVIPSPAQNKIMQNQYLQKQNSTSISNWSVVGPIAVLNNSGVPGKRQSNIYSIDQCASDSLVMYCGTEPGEVYKSLDEGNTWVNVSMNENFGSGVNAVEVDPNNSDIVFAGANAGVFRSQDGGATWINVLPQTNFGVNEILVNPSNSQLVLAASNKGLHRSVDGGASWVQ